jgi:hypothetical protein
VTLAVGSSSLVPAGGGRAIVRDGLTGRSPAVIRVAGDVSRPNGSRSLKAGETGPPIAEAVGDDSGWGIGVIIEESRD